MKTHDDHYLTPSDVVRIVKDHPRRWIVPTVALTVLAVAFAVAVYRPSYEASQGLIVRQNAQPGEPRPGRFADLTEMKSVQETILELARSRGVLEATLREVGPPAGYKATAVWPSLEDIESLGDAVTIAPPKGAEFGKTEVFYVSVKNADRARALALVGAICNKLEDGFQDLRHAKARSMIDELARTETLARANLDEATAELSAMESGVGSDLSELRNLQSATSGTSDIRQKIVYIENEIRAVEAQKRQNEELLELLRNAADDPGRLLASPSSLLTSQPGLSRLKDGLIDAQLATARLLGTMSADHPLVLGAKEAEAEIGQHLHDEIAIAIRGIDVELKLVTDRLADLNGGLAENRSRLERLAAVRAQYANLVTTVESRSQVLDAARRNLSDARASLAASESVSLLSRVDAAAVGNKPAGPGRTSIALAGMVGGLITGLGVLFLTTGPVAPVAPIERPVNGYAVNGATPNRRAFDRRGAERRGVNGNANDLSFKGALRKLAGRGGGF